MKIEYINISQIRKLDLLGKNVCLYDYENSCNIPKSTSNNDIYIVLEGKFQKGLLKKKISSEINTDIYVVTMESSGKNCLDFSILAIIGEIINKPKSIKIYSKDKGYDFYINAMANLGHHKIKRVSIENSKKTDQSLNGAMATLAQLYREKVQESVKITKTETKELLNRFKINKPEQRAHLYQLAKQMNAQLS